MHRTLSTNVKRTIWLVGLLVSLILLPNSNMPVSRAAACPALAADGSAFEQNIEPPTTVKIDDQGYITWSIDFSDISWCVPVSTLKYPIDLGTQDPSQLSDATLTINFIKRNWTTPNPIDPSWSVAWNGDPPADWRIVGELSGAVTNPEQTIQNSAAITVTADRIVDGLNYVWLKQHDTCPTPGCATCACTCIDIKSMSLRAAPQLKVKSVSPEPDAYNVPFDQSKSQDIRVLFTRPPDPESVSKQTFEVYYYDAELDPVLVTGEVQQLSAREFAFVPNQPLIDGIQYTAQIWGKEAAEEENRPDWIKDPEGKPLIESTIWMFWTMPDAKVEIVPVQVLEGAMLVVNKATALKVFLRWDAKEGVFTEHQLHELQVQDIIVSWINLQGNQAGDSAWTDDDLWLPKRTKESAMRKREYRQYNLASDSYDKFEKLASEDSVQYYGFLPLETGSYLFSAQVEILTSQGKTHSYKALNTLDSAVSRRLSAQVKAVAVGAAYGRTGTINLSNSVNMAWAAMKGIYPVPSVSRPTNPEALSWYKPSNFFSGLFNWKSTPASGPAKTYLLMELSELCALAGPCDAMVGYVPPEWLKDPGLSLPEWAPRGALVQFSTVNNNRYLTAHEIGHLYGFEHDELTGGEGFWVMNSSKDRRYSVTQLPPINQKTRILINNFMNIDPIESPQPERLWINPLHYEGLRAAINPPFELQAFAPQAPGADGLLLTAGGILEPAGTVSLLPWYQLPAGVWSAPEAGAYRLVFLDGAGVEIPGYSRSFGATSGDPAEMAFFTFKVPYPAGFAKVQIRRTVGGQVLKELSPAAGAPSLNVTALPPVLTGPQTLSWSSNSALAYALAYSGDGGLTWEPLAVNWITPTLTLETAPFHNTNQALVRVWASDGLRTTQVTAGPYTVHNPPLANIVSPAHGEMGVGVDAWITAGFRDAMNPATITPASFTLQGGPYGTVAGKVAYKVEDEIYAVFQPAVPLAYSTTYTVTLTTAIQDAGGSALPALVSWSFTTEANQLPPAPVTFLPQAGRRAVPLDTGILAVWDRDLQPGTLTNATFRLAAAGGSQLSGAVSYDSAARTVFFTPSAPLAPKTVYVAELLPGITSTDGNATVGAYRWSFTTGEAVQELPLAGSYSDYASDTNGDGLYDWLVIRVGVQLTETAAVNLAGALLDPHGSPIGYTSTQVTLPSGAHFVELAFSGAEIGGHGVDGPYSLSGVLLIRADLSTWQSLGGPVYDTFAYRAAQFPAPLRFSGLPDVLMPPGQSRNPAFNVRDYAQHVTLNSAELSYTLLAGGNPEAGVSLSSDGRLAVVPITGWSGTTRVAVQASDGLRSVQDTFIVRVGWASQVYLPLTNAQFNPSSSTLAPESYWRTALSTSFEGDFSWGVLSMAPGYFWGASTCAAYEGDFSGSPFGSPASGEPPWGCGERVYPNNVNSTVVTMPESFADQTVNLTYAAAAELRMKVLADLGSGDRICGLVSTESDYQLQDYFGVCRTGKTNGWEDLALDLANVPGLGNLLGQPDLRVALEFASDASGATKFGAYLDNVSLKVCLRGLPCQPGGTINPAPLVTGLVGGFDETVKDMALGVESNGRIHALWVGELPYFKETYDRRTFIFYAASSDGIHWSLAQALDGDSLFPQVLVDDARQRAHLLYISASGLVHRTVQNGIVSAPVTIAPPGVKVSAAVDAQTGFLHAVFLQIYQFPTELGYQLRQRTTYAYWDGSVWKAPANVINDDDTAHSTLAVAPGAGLLMTWFQAWGATSGGGVAPDEPRIPHSAYGPGLGDFPLRQAVHAGYLTPENDESLMLAYAGNGKFYLLTDHFMWPGHSRVYRYTWEAQAWSAPLDLSGNTASFASPRYLAATPNGSKVVYAYMENWVNRLRVETNGVLGAAQNLDTILNGLGYSGSIKLYMDASGRLHVLLAGTRNGAPGLYYLPLP